MVICPNCKHREVIGALFCSECGAQVALSPIVATATIKGHEIGSVRPVSKPIAPEAPKVINSDSIICLTLIDSTKTVALSGRTEYTIGRVTEGQPILPDVDLSPFEAYSQGVSRLHAAIKILNKHVAIMDLGSSNGTRVNGQKIVPNVDYPLKHGDLLALGRLKLQILFKK